MKPKKTIIHVNQHVIKSNRKNKKLDPVLTVKCGKSNIYAKQVLILDPKTQTVVAKIVYSPEKPLGCGAQVWVETFLSVEVIDDKTT